jgi:hypothetical protein
MQCRGSAMKTVQEAESGPRVIQAFQGYTPPFNATKAIRRMLKGCPTEILVGTAHRNPC